MCACDLMNTINYLFETQSHIHENIRFADQKAGATIGLNLAVFTALANGQVILPLLPEPIWAAAQIGTGVLLFLSTGVSAWVVYPRGAKAHHELPDGFGDCAVPEKIQKKWKHVEDFTRAFAGFSAQEPTVPDQLVKDLAALVWVRARINERKYRRLKFAMGIAFLSWASAAFLVARPWVDPLVKRIAQPDASASWDYPIDAKGRA